MMKIPFRLFSLLACIIVVSGCRPFALPASEVTSPPAINFLEVNGEKVEFEFLQNGVNVPLRGNKDQGKVTLKPEPFQLMVRGNKDVVSIMAVQSEDILLPLTQATKPVVHPSGTSQVFYQNNLYLQEKPLDISVADISFFTNTHFPEQTAQATADFLKSQLGTEPLIMISMRTYLGDSSGFTIETLNGNAMQNGQSIILAVFADQRLAEGPEEFIKWSLVRWLVFNIEFLSSQ